MTLCCDFDRDVLGETSKSSNKRVACEQAPSEVEKKNSASEWELERRDSASEASGTRGSL